MYSAFFRPGRRPGCGGGKRPEKAKGKCKNYDKKILASDL
jgi:hypothetical protein